MIYLAIIPMTVAFCFVIYLFMFALPNQLQSTSLGKTIWPILHKVWYSIFLTIAFAMMAGQTLLIVAGRMGWSDVASLTLNAIFVPAIYLTASFALLLVLTLALKVLQLCKIIA